MKDTSKEAADVGEERAILDPRMMGVVSVMAAECGLLRFVSETTLLKMIIVLPLLNFMLFGLLKLRRGDDARFFWIGFEAVGVTLLALCFFMAWREPTTLMLMFEPIQWLAEKKLLSDESPGQIAIALACIVAIYAPPQLLIASVAGWFSSRYRVVIERRSRWVGEGSPSRKPAIDDAPSDPLVALPTFREGSRRASD